MVDNDSETFGKKIFFLNPAYSVRKEIIAELQYEEYETYIIENYRDAKNILRKNRNSFLFANIDGQLSIGAWFNFLRTFEREEVLNTIFTAVISERIKQDDIDIFANIAKLPGGVLDFNEGTGGIMKRVKKILEANNAKGRRQYVRANLTYDREASIFWTYEGRLHELKILDLSSVGMSVKVPQRLAEQIIVKNFLLQNATLRLGVKQLIVEAVVFAVKQMPDATMWILLFMPQTAAAIKGDVKNYIYEANQREVMASINNDHQDGADYNQMNYYSLAVKHKTKIMGISGSM